MCFWNSSPCHNHNFNMLTMVNISWLWFVYQIDVIEFYFIEESVVEPVNSWQFQGCQSPCLMMFSPYCTQHKARMSEHTNPPPPVFGRSVNPKIPWEGGGGLIQSIGYRYGMSSFNFDKKFGKLRMIEIGPRGCWIRAFIFQMSQPSKNIML